MNAIPYFDYSLAPFWPSYQNKVVGVLERALREQSGSRIRRDRKSTRLNSSHSAKSRMPSSA